MAAVFTPVVSDAHVSTTSAWQGFAIAIFRSLSLNDHARVTQCSAPIRGYACATRGRTRHRWQGM